ncbi:MAG: hypothetical protein V1839_02130, partial [archaeon]
MIVTGLEPINDKKGSKTRIFLRENGKSGFIDTEIPRVFPSRKLSESQFSFTLQMLAERFYINMADELKRDLAPITVQRIMRSNETKQGAVQIDVRVKRYGFYQRVVEVRGPREIRAQLPHEFRQSAKVLGSTVNQMINYEIPVFSKIVIDNGYPRVVGKATREELLQEKMLAIDTELDKEGGVNYDRINSSTSVCGCLENIISENKISIFHPDVGDHRKLAFLQSENIVNEDPFHLLGQNFSFDYEHLRELTRNRPSDSVFRPGVDGSEPKIAAVTGFLKKMYVPGRQSVDSLSYAQNWLWSMNNKLETLAKFFGIDYKKGLDYDTVESLIQDAEKGNLESAEKVLQYCLEDCRIHYAIGKKILPDIIDLALLFETDTASICWDSKSTLARKLRDKRFYEKLNTVRKDRRKEMMDFDIFDAKNHMMEMTVDTNPQRGLFEDVYVVYNSFLSEALKDTIMKDKTFSTVYERLNSKTDSKS